MAKGWLVQWVMEQEHLDSTETTYVVAPTKEQAIREVESMDPEIVGLAARQAIE